MLSRLLTIVILFTATLNFSAQSQGLNWHLTAQAGTANYQFRNFQGAFLGGFKSVEGQQLSFGPVVKGYAFNSHLTNLIGGRIYSQVKAYGGLSMYMQCDVFGGSRSFSMASSRSPMRLETGAGLIYTFRETVGLSVGYNLAELNPANGVRKNTPSVKLIYLMPFGQRNW